MDSEYGGSAGLIRPPPHVATVDGAADRRGVRDAALLLRRTGNRAGALPVGPVPDHSDVIGP